MTSKLDQLARKRTRLRQQAAGITMETIVEARQFLDQVPVGAALHPRLTTRHHTHRAVAEAELHATRVGAAEDAVTCLLAETGVVVGVVAHLERRVAARDHERSATLLHFFVRWFGDRREDV